MAYRYETHLHTKESSLCGKSSGAEYVSLYKNLGYDGIFITDHFYHGNCAIPKELPWTEWVDNFYKGFEAAFTEGEKAGLKVFFAWEEKFDGDEYLIYGPGKEWLYRHPEIKTCTREEQYRLVREAGGCVVQAHPFRDRAYINGIHLEAEYVDAAEAVNFGNKEYEDKLALLYTQKYGLIQTAGSDTHSINSINPELPCIEYEIPLESAEDYAARIIRGDAPALVYPAARTQGETCGSIRLGIEISKNGLRGAELSEVI